MKMFGVEMLNNKENRDRRSGMAKSLEIFGSGSLWDGKIGRRSWVGFALYYWSHKHCPRNSPQICNFPSMLNEVVMCELNVEIMLDCKVDS